MIRGSPAYWREINVLRDSGYLPLPSLGAYIEPLQDGLLTGVAVRYQGSAKVVALIVRSTVLTSINDLLQQTDDLKPKIASSFLDECSHENKQASNNNFRLHDSDSRRMRRCASRPAVLSRTRYGRSTATSR